MQLGGQSESRRRTEYVIQRGASHSTVPNLVSLAGEDRVTAFDLGAISSMHRITTMTRAKIDAQIHKHKSSHDN